MHGFVDPEPLIRALWSAQAGRCFHCNDPMIFTENGGIGIPKGLTATREHIYPRGLNGKGMHRNVVLAHSNCNNKRGCRNPTPEEITKTKALYMTMGLVPFVSGHELDDLYFVRRKLNTFQAPKMGDIWPR